MRRALLALTLSIAGLPPAGPAAAAISDDARPVVERYVRALGGREAIGAMRSLYEKGTVRAFGLTGPAEFWSQRPDRTASSLTIGPITVADGWDGAVAWRMDPGGKLTLRDGKDLEDAKSDAYFANDRWLDPDQAGGTVKRVGTESDSTGRYEVLEVAPPMGRTRTLRFDASTGLLARVVTHRDQNTIVTTLSDYRRVGPLLHAHRQWVHVQELPANDATVTIDSVALNAVIPASRFSPPAEAAAPVRWLARPGVARLPFQYLGRHLWLKVAVNGRPPADFLFDTGASLTVLDSAWAAGAGIVTQGRQQGQGAAATGNASFAKLDSLRVQGPDGDGVALTDLRVGVLSVNPILSPYFWRDAAGILGFDFISRFVSEIDYDTGTLVLRDPRDFAYKGKGHAVPMTLAGTVPVIEMRLDGRWSGKFRVDVGSGSTLDLHTPFVTQNGLLELPGRTLEVMGGGFGGTFTSTVRRMKTLEVGGYTVGAPLVGLSHATLGAFASQDYAGNLGNRLLDRFRVTLDYQRRTLWLEPGRRFAERDVFPRAGVQLLRQDGVVRAGMVLPGSPAEKAGVREGDEVIAIDGTPVASWDAEKLTRTLEQGAEGSSHTLAVKRDGGPVTLRFALKEPL